MPSERIHVTGSVKFDGVHADRGHPRVNALRTLLGLEAADHPRPLIWVVGSTQAPEEAWALDLYQRAKQLHARLRLVLVPRHAERFDEVAEMLRQSDVPFVRRSRLKVMSVEDSLPISTGRDPVILIDTLGELRYVWGLAHVAFVGGSFSDRGGQNMIEPAAYGGAVIFGPHVWNFKEVAHQLIAAGGAMQVADFQQLESAVQSCLVPDTRASLGQNAQRMALSQQGATERTLAMIDRFLPERAFNVVRRAG
jgi:3-deoxy-D-manno-octulosonic-acid transferase